MNFFALTVSLLAVATMATTNKGGNSSNAINAKVPDDRLEQMTSTCSGVNAKVQVPRLEQMSLI